MGILVEGERLPLARCSPTCSAAIRAGSKLPGWPFACRTTKASNCTARRQTPARAGRPPQAAGRNADRPLRRPPAATCCACRASTRRAWPSCPTSAAGSSAARATSWPGRTPACRPGHRPDVEPPPAFRLDLRPYQREGLAWLQFLREPTSCPASWPTTWASARPQGPGPPAAGKEAGLDKPALVILPTSLIFNWKTRPPASPPPHGAQPARAGAQAAVSPKSPSTTWCSPPTRSLARCRRADAPSTICSSSTRRRRSRTRQPERRSGAQDRRAAPPVPPARRWKTTSANCGASSISCFPASSAPARTSPATGGRRSRSRATWPGAAAGPPHPPLHPAPQEGRRRQELPPKTIIVRSVELEGRQRDLYEPCAPRWMPRCATRSPPGLCAQPDRHPRRPAQAAPGVLRPAPGQDQHPPARCRSAPSSTC